MKKLSAILILVLCMAFAFTATQISNYDELLICDRLQNTNDSNEI